MPNDMNSFCRKMTVSPQPGIAKKDMAKAGMKAVFVLKDLWNLSHGQTKALLGMPAQRTYDRWKTGEIGHVSHDLLDRLSYIAGIHKALRMLYRNPDNIYGWITAPNRQFGGQPPIDRMTAGSLTDLAFVRAHLDTLRGGR